MTNISLELKPIKKSDRDKAMKKYLHKANRLINKCKKSTKGAYSGVIVPFSSNIKSNMVN